MTLTRRHRDLCQRRSPPTRNVYAGGYMFRVSRPGAAPGFADF
jgi:hypothetical protein